MDYINYEIKMEDLTEKQVNIIDKFNNASGLRAKAKTFKTVSVGFYKGICFDVQFYNQ